MKNSKEILAFIQGRQFSITCIEEDKRSLEQNVTLDVLINLENYITNSF